ncbi:hypothetical protein RMQ97_09665 [Maricaulis sp. D1M11]|uniref:head-tail connector protein n=1 Tax=Maricaulis sp. D1M11 TaxID=3076117 RepID=UPI0039B3851D
MSLHSLAPPAVEPVTVGQIRDRLRLSDDRLDGPIRHWIRSARRRVEQECQLALIEQTLVERLDHWGQDARLSGFGEAFRLARRPVLAFEQLVLIDEEEQDHPVTPWPFRLDSGSHRARLVLKADACWPAPLRPTQGLVLTYRAGFGARAEQVPDELVEAMQQWVIAWAEGAALDQAPPPVVRDLMSAWTRVCL